MPRMRPALSAAAPLVVGVVNGMPGEARARTETQFRVLLAAAAGERVVAVHCFSLDEDPAALAEAALDGLIVTGMPPGAGSLAAEPSWPKLVRLVDMALDGGVPAIWSCLAAHAAVLYLDGIERRRLPAKLSALVECTLTGLAHPLAAGLPPRWRAPHSRYNGVPEEALRAHGYVILSSTAEAGADIFVKDAGAPFLFCQGHPEYSPDTLLREYRRDVREFLAGERDAYPPMPRSYFDPEATAALARFQLQAEAARRPDTLAGFPFQAVAAGLAHPWRAAAICLYSNWLTLLAARRDARSAVRRGAGHAELQPAALMVDARA